MRNVDFLKHFLLIYLTYMKESMQFAKTLDNQPPPAEVFNVGKKTSHIADVLIRLNEIQGLIEEDGLDKYKLVLKNLYDNENSYFVRKKIEQIIKLPLDDLDMESKRIFLKNNWEDMRREMSKCTVVDKISGELVNLQKIEKLNPLESDDMSDFDVERYFSLYRKLALYRYNVYEANRYEHFYNDKNIIDNYRMPETRLTNAYPFYFSRLNSKYCALYNSGECGADKFYKLDEAAEKSVKERESAEGSILNPDLEDIIISLEEAAREKDTAYLKEYIYFRRNLPQTLRDNLDRSLQLQIPPEMDKEFCDDDEFIIYLHKYSDKIKISNNEKDLDVLWGSLRALLEQKYKTSAEKNQGFKIDNLGVLKNIAQSYFNVLEGQYYWFEDYLRQKKFLPEDLICEFEKKFAVDFLKYSTEEFPYYDNSIFRDIKKKKLAIGEHFHWLGNEIMKRVEEVNAARPELEEVKFEEILKEEGFNKENLSSAETDIIIANYKTLMELQIRKEIEDEFGIKLTEFSFREQAQFVNFLSAKPSEEVARTKEFLHQGRSEMAKAQRVKSFLSLESGAEMGERILSIGENLQDRPESADRLFAEYARLVDGANQEVEEISRMYGEIFFQRGVDKDKVARAILRKAGSLLCEAGEILKNCDSDKREDLVEDLISHLKIEDKAQKTSISDLKKLSVQLNRMYHRLDRFNIPGEKNKEAEAEMTEFFKELKSGKIKLGEFKTEDVIKEIEQEKSILRKYDSQRLQDEIKSYESLVKMSDEIYEIIKAESGQKTADRMRELHNQEGCDFYKPLVKKLKELLAFQQNFEQKLDQFVYGYETAGLPDNFQEEIKADIANYQPELPQDDKGSYLPVGISSQLPEKDEAHLKPIDALAYLFWLQNQKKNSELMVVDTIQETNYQALYNLSGDEARLKAGENGNRDRKWYGAAIKVFNLDNIELAGYKEIEDSAAVRGALDSINQLDEGEKGKRSEIISKALDVLVEGSIKRKIQGGDGAEEDKNKLLREYGKKEIAFIMARQGRKISHEKEYRYDILARVALIYEELKKRKDEIIGLNREFLSRKKAPNERIGRELSSLDKKLSDDGSLVELSLYLAYFHDFPAVYHTAADLFSAEQNARNLRSRKDKSAKNVLQELRIKSEELKGIISAQAEAYGADMEKTKPILKNIKTFQLLRKGREPEQVMAEWRGLGKRITREEWFKNLQLPSFHYPQSITGLSFEMRDEDRPGFTAFREFYSTHKGKSEEDLPIQANQVIASTNPLAAAKLLVLDEKKQKEYFNKVLRPLLVNYYLASSKNKEEAQRRFEEDIKEAATIAQVIELIQRKIIWPLEMELKAEG